MNFPVFILGFAISVGTSNAAVNSLGMEFSSIPAGEFIMGNADFEESILELPDGDSSLIVDELPAHHVKITRPFKLSRTEVTQGQWYALMQTRPGSAKLWQRADWQNLPVVSVTWNDAQRFIKKLNQREKTFSYRLPTEAEWEYAARAGNVQNRPFPVSELAVHAWFLDNSGDMQHPVATRQPNEWGLYDMLGNAWEWVADRYQPDTYSHHSLTDPQVLKKGEKRVRRGGSYHCLSHMTRVSYRAADTPNTSYSVIGFRVVLEEK